MSAAKSKSGSLPPCAICNTKIAIYKCPRCHTCTCSLECCRVHKEDPKINGGKGCDGKRDRTQFCSMKGFTDSQLASDYHFLEDVLKVSESSKRMYQGIVTGDSSAHKPSGAIVKRLRVNNDGPNSGRVELDSISTKPPAHPLLRAKEGKNAVDVLAHGVDDINMELNETQFSHQSNGIVNELLANKPVAKKPAPPKRGKIDYLVRQAELKGVNLLRMPPGMERRRSNTTKFNKKKGIITWKIELCFHQPANSMPDGDKVADEKPMPKFLKVESESCESSTLLEELGKHLDVHPGNSTTRSQLRTFAAAPRNSLLLFMKRLPSSSAAPQYFKLDLDAALEESLKGKTIIEFPAIDVVMETDKDKFPLFIGELS